MPKCEFVCDVAKYFTREKEGCHIGLRYHHLQANASARACTVRKKGVRVYANNENQNVLKLNMCGQLSE